MEQLQQFYENIGMRETVKEFIIEHLKKHAVDQIFSKQATAGIYEAKKAVDDAFSRMQELFEKKPSKKEFDTPR